MIQIRRARLAIILVLARTQGVKRIVVSSRIPPGGLHGVSAYLCFSGLKRVDKASIVQSSPIEDAKRKC